MQESYKKELNIKIVNVFIVKKCPSSAEINKVERPLEKSVLKNMNILLI